MPGRFILRLAMPFKKTWFHLDMYFEEQSFKFNSKTAPCPEKNNTQVDRHFFNLETVQAYWLGRFDKRILPFESIV